MTTAKSINLNHQAPEIGLYAEIQSEISYEAGFPGKVIDAENLNFKVYVMMGANTPDRRIDEIHPNVVKLVDYQPHVQYQKKWYPLTGIPANSCQLDALLPAIIVGYQ